MLFRSGTTEWLAAQEGLTVINQTNVGGAGGFYTGIQYAYQAAPGVLFTFPSQYYALSVTKEYLALEGGPSDFPQGFSCLAVLWILPLPTVFMYGAFTLSGLPSQAVPLTDRLTYAVLNPSMHARWFGLFRVRSPLLPESMFLSLPPAT